MIFILSLIFTVLLIFNESIASVNVKIISNNALPYQKSMIDKVQPLMTKTINSKEFKNAIVNSTFTETNGKSSEQIYKDLMSYDWIVRVQFYRQRFFGAVGYRTPPSPQIYTNTYFFDGYDECSVLNHWLHESTHVIGYDHLNVFATSVPYKSGDLAEVVCRKGVFTALDGHIEVDPTPIPPIVIEEKPIHYIPWYKRFASWVIGLF